MEEFFASGEQNFLHMREGFDRLSIPLTPEGKALDYGCGVGRVLKPFGQYFQQAVGIDVSRAMVEDA
ncbi:MAG: methyltransferase domain-containing protein, partial [Candidatus Latescibacteria bacterium]|nr:methyltransferase domain-containing protein [Candidatus Latescibacterota bacterium]